MSKEQLTLDEVDRIGPAGVRLPDVPDQWPRLFIAVADEAGGEIEVRAVDSSGNPQGSTLTVLVL